MEVKTIIRRINPEGGLQNEWIEGDIENILNDGFELIASHSLSDNRIWLLFKRGIASNYNLTRSSDKPISNRKPPIVPPSPKI